MSKQEEVSPANGGNESKIVVSAPGVTGKTVARPGCSVIVVGTGAVGTYAADLLARIAGVRKVTLVDREIFDEGNIWGQRITRRDIGRPKAEALADHIRETRPDLEVVAIVADVEDLPLVTLRGDVVLCAVDSRRARWVIAENCWRLAVPFIDVGIEAEGFLARVNVYVPGAENCCPLCNWSPQDYDALEQIYSCPGGARAAVPTNAPAALGAMAAALQVLECHKLLNVGPGHALVGRELLMDAAWNKQYVSVQRRNAACRFDHEIWRIDAVPGSTTLAAALATVVDSVGADEPLHDTLLTVDRKAFAFRLTCADCGRVRGGPRLVGLARGFGAASERCPDCGGELVASGFETSDRLAGDAVPQSVLRSSLAELGLLPGEVFTVYAPLGARHFEVMPASVETN